MFAHLNDTEPEYSSPEKYSAMINEYFNDLLDNGPLFSSKWVRGRELGNSSYSLVQMVTGASIEVVMVKMPKREEELVVITNRRIGTGSSTQYEYIEPKADALMLAVMRSIGYLRGQE